MFGQSKPFSFGTTGTGFGGQAATTFGATTQPTFGSFGTQNQQNSSMFGNAATATGSGLFGGTTPAFGSNTNTQSTGFSFGQAAAPATGGLFGGNQTGGLFATPATKTSTFGGFGNNTSTSTSLFGGTSTSSGSKLFGATGTTSNLFGTTTAFGAASAPNGTTVKFNPPAGSDTMLKNGISTSISTKHQCITAMKEYESKSIEELRVEDYLANRKGPTTTGTASLFGTGNQAIAGFGGGTTGFSLSAPATKSGFGAGFGGFSATTTTGPQANIFGGTQQKSLFGSTATTTTASTGFGGFGGGTSLFANSVKPAFGGTTAGFGATANTGFGGGTTTNFGGFGGGTSTGSSLFGNKTAFGTTTTTASTGGTGFSFGSTANTGSSLFGGNANKPTTGGFGGFGAASGTGFGTGGTSLFSQNKPTGFGVGTGTTGFGASTGFGNQLGGGLFGTNTQTNTAFNTNPLGLQANTQLSTLGAASNAGTAAAAAQQAQIQHQLIALTNSPYGDSPLFRNLTQDPSKREDLKPTNPAAQKAILSQASQYKVGGAIRTTPKIKAKPLNSLLADGKSQLFEGLEEDDSSFGGNDTFMPRKSVKKLVIKKSSPNNSSLSSSFLHSRNDDDLVAPATTYYTSMTTPQRPIEEQVETPEVILGSKSVGRPSLSDERPSLDDTISVLNAKNKKNLDSVDSLQEEFNRDGDSERSVSPPPTPHPTGIVLHRPGYYTVPSLDELADLVDNNGDCFVENFTVGREGYGSVFFPGETNVANMNLDEIVHFRRKEITIYPDDNNKPEEGQGLNKKAEVTLDCVWPTDKTTRSPIKSPERLMLMSYHDKIELSTMRIGAKFIDYRPETGSWVFEVKHFSKYGLVDDSDEEDNSEANIKKLKMLQQQQLNLQKQKIQLINGQQPPATVKQQQLQQQLPDKQLAPPVEILQEPMVNDEDSDMEDIERESLPVVPSDGDDEMPGSLALLANG